MRSFLSVSRTVRASLFSTAAVGLATSLAPAAQAQNIVSYNVTLASTSPRFNRPTTTTALSGVGTNVYYQAQQFTVNTAGLYSFETTAATLTPIPADDTFIALYQTSFNAASPLTNLIAVDDDAGVGALSLISNFTLSNTSQYFLVSTTFNNLTTGSITSRISGPAGSVVTLVTPAAAPEPGSLSLLGMGLAGGVGTLGIVRRRRKAA